MMLRFSLLLLALSALTVPARAQWDVDAQLDVAAQSIDNVFRAPDVLRQAPGTVLDSLVRPDVAIPLELGFGVERRWARHELGLDLEGDWLRFRSFGLQNEQTLQAELHYEGLVREAVTVQVEAGLGHRSASGTDVLGEELNRLFSYTEHTLHPELAWAPARRHTLTAEVRWRQRDYATQPGALPLDYTDTDAAVGWAYELRTDRPQQLDVEVALRRKQYTAYRARNQSGRQADDYPLNRLDYAELGIDYAIEWSRRFETSLKTRLMRRTDPFEGYYSYRYAKLDGEVAWEPWRGTTLEAGLAWRTIQYLNKTAFAADGTPEGQLHYQYLDADVTLTYAVDRSLSLYLRWASDRRHSNVDLETMATRRSYAVQRWTLGLEADLDRLVKAVR